MVWQCFGEHDYCALLGNRASSSETSFDACRRPLITLYPNVSLVPT